MLTYWCEDAWKHNHYMQCACFQGNPVKSDGLKSVHKVPKVTIIRVDSVLKLYKFKFSLTLRAQICCGNSRKNEGISTNSAAVSCSCLLFATIQRF